MNEIPPLRKVYNPATGTSTSATPASNVSALPPTIVGFSLSTINVDKVEDAVIGKEGDLLKKVVKHLQIIWGELDVHQMHNAGLCAKFDSIGRIFDDLHCDFATVEESKEGP